MHFEILVEDASGKIILESVLKKILSRCIHKHSYTIHGYKGIGRIPKSLKQSPDPQKKNSYGSITRHSRRPFSLFPP
jgi:hypothetical protein